MARLRDPDPAVRRAACREASRDPSAVLLVDALGEALGDEVASVGLAASQALADLAPQHGAVDEVLRRALHADEPRRRFGAARTRAQLAPPEPGLLPALVEAMGDADSGTRWAAARIFVDLGRLHGEALPVALGLARTDPSAVVRRMAVLCLAKLAPHEDATAGVLLEAGEDPDREVRHAALVSMAALTTAPPAVFAALTRALGDERDLGAARLASFALGALGERPGRLPDSSRAALERAAAGGDPPLARDAERALARAGQKTSASSE